MTAESPPHRNGLAIAQVIETLDTGGAEHLAIKFANKLAERGHRSHIYVTSHSGPLAASISDEVQVDILGYRRQSIVNPLKFLLSINDGFNRLKYLLKKDRIDLIQTHLPGPNFWGLALTLRGVCSSVATIHNNQEFSYGSVRSVRGALRHFAYKMIVRRCAATIAVSDQVRVSLLAELGMKGNNTSRLISIPNGVEISPVVDFDDKMLAKSKLGIDNDLIIGLAIGRVCEQKNFHDLIPVMEEIKHQGNSIRMIVAGDGPDHADLRERIAVAGLENDIHTLGNVTNIPEYLNAADIFLMPSLWEGLPLALLEAMAARLPVVGHSIDGLTDVVDEGITGHLVKPGDHKLMAEKIVLLAQNPELRQTMGTAGRKLVEKRYNLERVVDDIETLYHNVLARGQA
jgi:glycosyltransferase involved in cell wall biosynthesis